MQFVVVGPITQQRTIAVGRRIRCLQSLVKPHGPGRWQKKAGSGWVRLADGTVRFAELHWYEAPGIGRRNMKVKRYLDQWR